MILNCRQFVDKSNWSHHTVKNMKLIGLILKVEPARHRKSAQALRAGASLLLLQIVKSGVTNCPAASGFRLLREGTKFVIVVISKKGVTSLPAGRQASACFLEECTRKNIFWSVIRNPTQPPLKKGRSNILRCFVCNI